MNITHGGRREGAGRRPGSQDKATIERTIRAQHGIAAALEAGLMPLDVILAVMRGEPLSNGLLPTERQFGAAIAAAPFLHARLSASVVKADVTTSTAPTEPMVSLSRMLELAARKKSGPVIEAKAAETSPAQPEDPS